MEQQTVSSILASAIIGDMFAYLPRFTTIKDQVIFSPSSQSNSRKEPVFSQFAAFLPFITIATLDWLEMSLSSKLQVCNIFQDIIVQVCFTRLLDIVTISSYTKPCHMGFECGLVYIWTVWNAFFALVLGGVLGWPVGRC